MATYVLMHGAFSGGWIWKYVAGHLKAAGHDVYTPTLDGCAHRGHQLRPEIALENNAREMVDYLFYHDLHDIMGSNPDCPLCSCLSVEESVNVVLVKGQRFGNTGSGTGRGTEDFDLLFRDTEPVNDRLPSRIGIFSNGEFPNVFQCRNV